ncbi:MAG: MotA/TolQ/ExbB proton channel family protein [Planctomycetales bacterium]|nr:MotA/TolQ/ExbB proton channel family protein [Planctomycetales bacterium]
MGNEWVGFNWGLKWGMTVGLLFATSFCCLAQEPAAGISQDELQRLASEAAAGQISSGSPTSLPATLSFFALLRQGGWLMVPLAAMSLLVLAVALERFVALRRAKLFPRGLRREIRRMSEESDPIDPLPLFVAAEKYPSSASRVLKDMLVKTGRPITEAENQISASVQCEADRLYGNVRWLGLAASISPLIGLLGTVWGMILAFYNTTHLGAGKNKAEFLAEGIYVALVTTLVGLAVAIPAAIFAHYFEGQITKMLSKIEGELKGLVPRFEALEGRVRYDMHSRGVSTRSVERSDLQKSNMSAPAMLGQQPRSSV